MPGIKKEAVYFSDTRCTTPEPYVRNGTEDKNCPIHNISQNANSVNASGKTAVYPIKSLYTSQEGFAQFWRISTSFNCLACAGLF